MTTVLIDLAHLTGTATNGASTGMVEVRYSKRIEPADPASQIVVVRSFAVKLDATGKASVVVPPSEVDGFYTWTERVEGGTTRYTSVPDVPTVNYRTLVDVDPATFDPTVDATAAWYLALAALELGDLADVDTTDLADGFTLVWEAASSTWKVGAGGAGASALGDLTDVDLTDLADGDALVWDATAGTWVRVPLSSTYVAQADPASVAGLSPTTDGAGGYSWEPGGGGGGVTDHGALSGLADDDHTQYALADGSRGSFAATAHTHTASQISDSTTTGRSLITAATATAARTAISAAPALGSDDNYVTDAEKAALHTHPAVIAQGATAADARAAIGAGTSSLVIGTGAGDAKAGDYAPDLSGLVPKSLVDAKGDLLVGTADNTPARLAVGSAGDSLTPNTGATPGVEWGIPLLKIAQNSNTSITPALTDHGKYIELTATTAVTITLPQDSAVAFPIGSYVIYKATTAAGLATFQQGTGATLRDYTPSAVMRGEGSSVQATKVASNTWTLDGDLATP